MTALFPNDRETIVKPESPEEVLFKIASEIQKPFKGLRGENLTGWVKDSEFQLTIQLRRQHLFMPVVNGSVEKTSKGVIVFLRYTLFPGTRLLLFFWTCVMLIAGGFMSYRYSNYWIIAGCVAFLGILHGIAWANFNLHVKTTQKILHRVLD